MINLAHLVRYAPRMARMRKRQGRTMRPVKPSRKNELWYRVELLDIVRQLTAGTRAELEPMLKLYSMASPMDSGLVTDRSKDRATPPFGPAFDRLARRFGDIGKGADRLAQIAAAKALDASDESLIASAKQAIGVDVGGLFRMTPGLAKSVSQATAENVRLIKSIPDQFLDKVQEAVETAWTDGLRWEDIVGDIERIGGVTESRAKLIARDQMSKMNSAFTSERQQSVGIESYIWQTAGDERVRDEHADQNGERFQWADPPTGTGHPGEDINCRCVAVPYFDLDAMEAAAGLN